MGHILILALKHQKPRAKKLESSALLQVIKSPKADIMLARSRTTRLIVLISAIIVSCKDVNTDEVSKEVKDARKNAKLPPCGACSALVKSFEAGMQRTSRGKLEGGDTAWEEKNQVCDDILNKEMI